MKLSVLDQSAALTGRSEADSIRETLALASFCESLGYHRFWLSEHHNLAAIVGTAPEILMAAIAATTQRQPKPEPTFCVWALAADTEQQARHSPSCN